MSYTGLGRFATPSFDEFGKPLLTGHDQFGYHAYAFVDDTSGGQIYLAASVSAEGARIVYGSDCSCGFDASAGSGAGVMLCAAADALCEAHGEATPGRVLCQDGGCMVGVVVSGAGESLVTLAASVQSSTIAVPAYIAVCVGALLVACVTHASCVAVRCAPDVEDAEASCGVVSSFVRMRSGSPAESGVLLGALSFVIAVRGATAGAVSQSHVGSLSCYAVAAHIESSVRVHSYSVGSYVVCVDAPDSFVRAYGYGDVARMLAVAADQVTASGLAPDVPPIAIRRATANAWCVSSAFAVPSYVVDSSCHGNVFWRIEAGARSIHGGYGGAAVIQHTRGEPTRVVYAVGSGLAISVALTSVSIQVFLSSADADVVTASAAGSARSRYGGAYAFPSWMAGALSSSLFAMRVVMDAETSMAAFLAKPMDAGVGVACVSVAAYSDSEIFVPSSRPGAGYTHLGRFAVRGFTEHGQLFGPGYDQFGYPLYVMPQGETLSRLVGADAVPSAAECFIEAISCRVVCVGAETSVSCSVEAVAVSEYWPRALVHVGIVAVSGSTRMLRGLAECDIPVRVESAGVRVVAAACDDVVAVGLSSALGARVLDCGAFVAVVDASAVSDMDGLKCAAASVDVGCSAYAAAYTQYVGHGEACAVASSYGAAARGIVAVPDIVLAALVAESYAVRVVVDDLWAAVACVELLAGSQRIAGGAAAACAGFWSQSYSSYVVVGLCDVASATASIVSYGSMIGEIVGFAVISADAWSAGLRMRSAVVASVASVGVSCGGVSIIRCGVGVVVAECAAHSGSYAVLFGLAGLVLYCFVDVASVRVLCAESIDAYVQCAVHASFARVCAHSCAPCIAVIGAQSDGVRLRLCVVYGSASAYAMAIGDKESLSLNAALAATASVLVEIVALCGADAAALAAGTASGWTVRIAQVQGGAASSSMTVAGATRLMPFEAASLASASVGAAVETHMVGRGHAVARAQCIASGAACFDGVGIARAGTLIAGASGCSRQIASLVVGRASAGNSGLICARGLKIADLQARALVVGSLAKYLGSFARAAISCSAQGSAYAAASGRCYVLVRGRVWPVWSGSDRPLCVMCGGRADAKRCSLVRGRPGKAGQLRVDASAHAVGQIYRGSFGAIKAAAGIRAFAAYCAGPMPSCLLAWCRIEAFSTRVTQWPDVWSDIFGRGMLWAFPERVIGGLLRHAPIVGWAQAAVALDVARGLRPVAQVHVYASSLDDFLASGIGRAVCWAHYVASAGCATGLACSPFVARAHVADLTLVLARPLCPLPAAGVARLSCGPASLCARPSLIASAHAAVLSSSQYSPAAGSGHAYVRSAASAQATVVGYVGGACAVGRAAVAAAMSRMPAISLLEPIVGRASCIVVASAFSTAYMYARTYVTSHAVGDCVYSPRAAGVRISASARCPSGLVQPLLVGAAGRGILTAHMVRIVVSAASASTRVVVGADSWQYHGSKAVAAVLAAVRVVGSAASEGRSDLAVDIRAVSGNVLMRRLALPIMGRCVGVGAGPMLVRHGKSASTVARAFISAQPDYYLGSFGRLRARASVSAVSSCSAGARGFVRCRAFALAFATNIHQGLLVSIHGLGRLSTCRLVRVDSRRPVAPGIVAKATCIPDWYVGPLVVIRTRMAASASPNCIWCGSLYRPSYVRAYAVAFANFYTEWPDVGADMLGAAGVFARLVRRSDEMARIPWCLLGSARCGASLHHYRGLRGTAAVECRATASGNWNGYVKGQAVAQTRVRAHPYYDLLLKDASCTGRAHVGLDIIAKLHPLFVRAIEGSAQCGASLHPYRGLQGMAVVECRATARGNWNGFANGYAVAQVRTRVHPYYDFLLKSLSCVGRASAHVGMLALICPLFVRAVVAVAQVADVELAPWFRLTCKPRGYGYLDASLGYVVANGVGRALVEATVHAVSAARQDIRLEPIRGAATCVAKRLIRRFPVDRATFINGRGFVRVHIERRFVPRAIAAAKCTAIASAAYDADGRPYPLSAAVCVTITVGMDCPIDVGLIVGRALMKARVVRPVMSDIRPLAVRAYVYAVSDEHNVGSPCVIGVRGSVYAEANACWSPALRLEAHAHFNMLGGLPRQLEAELTGRAIMGLGIVRLVDAGSVYICAAAFMASGLSFGPTLSTNIIGEANVGAASCNYIWSPIACADAHAYCQAHSVGSMSGVAVVANVVVHATAVPGRFRVCAFAGIVGIAEVECLLPWCERIVGRAIVADVALVYGFTVGAVIRGEASCSAYAGSSVYPACRIFARASVQASFERQGFSVEPLERDDQWHVDDDLDRRPDIRYPRKPAEPWMPQEAEEEPEAEPVEKPPYLQTFAALTLTELLDALAAVDAAITAARDMSMRAVVTIDAVERPTLAQSIRQFCVMNDNPEGVIYNDDSINYSVMARALVAVDKPGSDVVVSEWALQMAASDEPYATAGEVAPLLLGLRAQLVDAIKFAGDYVAEQAAGRTVTVGADGAINPNHLQELEQAEKTGLDRLRDYMQEAVQRISKDEHEAYYALEQKYSEAASHRRSLYDLADALRKQAAEAKGQADRAMYLMKAEAADILGDSLCCFARKILDKLDYGSGAEFEESVQKARRSIKQAKAIMVMWLQSNALDYLQLRKPINAQLAQFARLQAAFFMDVRRQVMQPVVAWFNEMFEPVEQAIEGVSPGLPTYADSCLPFEKIGSLVLEGIEGMLKKYNEAVADQFRAAMGSFTIANLMLDSIEKRNEMRKVMLLFDDLVKLVDTVEARYAGDQKELRDGIDGVLETFLTTFQYNKLYDSETGSIRRIPTLCG